MQDVARVRPDDVRAAIRPPPTIRVIPFGARTTLMKPSVSPIVIARSTRSNGQRRLPFYRRIPAFASSSVMPTRATSGSVKVAHGTTR